MTNGQWVELVRIQRILLLDWSISQCHFAFLFIYGWEEISSCFYTSSSSLVTSWDHSFRESFKTSGMFLSCFSSMFFFFLLFLFYSSIRKERMFRQIWTTCQNANLKMGVFINSSLWEIKFDGNRCFEFLREINFVDSILKIYYMDSWGNFFLSDRFSKHKTNLSYQSKWVHSLWFFFFFFLYVFIYGLQHTRHGYVCMYRKKKLSFWLARLSQSSKLATKPW